MYTILLFMVVIIALAISLRRNGIGSFVTLGIIGATIYTIPALINMQLYLATATKSHQAYVSVPDDVKFVTLMAWLGLLLGLTTSILLFPRTLVAKARDKVDVMQSIATSSAILETIGFIYLSINSENPLFFLIERADQSTDAISILWKWTILIGLISSFLSGRRTLLFYSCVMLFVIFVRGDRTIVALAIAAFVVAASYKNPRWYLQLNPFQISGLALGAIVVFFGKSVYLTIKSGIAGNGWDPISFSTKAQFMSQFEPLGTFSHLEYVMRTGVTIDPWNFLESVLGNVLIVPSAFGLSTNLYNAVVSATLSPKFGYGIAGNYLAHGYTVAGTMGAALFYFILPLMLRLCDGQFRAKDGSVKIFWCCVGAVIAFYIHRNGLDNGLSFVRQVFIMSVITAALAAALRHFGIARQPQRRAIGRHRPGPDDGEFLLSPIEAPPRSHLAPRETRPPA